MTDRELMQMALDALEKISMGGDPRWADDVMPALRARLAQPEPEPVAWLYEGSDIEGRDVCLNEDIFEEQKLNCIPLYTAPPQRDETPANAVEWQGLTDEEAEQITDAHWDDPDMFIEVVTKKLKEKNT